MTAVDAKVREAVADPSATARVLLTTSRSTSEVRPALDAAGIAVRSEIPDLGVIAASVTAKDLPALEDLPGVDAVELDEQAQAL